MSQTSSPLIRPCNGNINKKQRYSRSKMLLLRTIILVFAYSRRDKAFSVVAWQPQPPSSPSFQRHYQYRYERQQSHRDCRPTIRHWRSSPQFLDDSSQNSLLSTIILTSTLNGNDMTFNQQLSSDGQRRKDSNRKKRISRRCISAGLVSLGLLSTAFLFPSKALAAITTTTASAVAASSSAANTLTALPIEAVTTAAAATTAPTLFSLHPAGNIVTRSLEMKLSCRLLFASLMGAIVGWERSDANHSAGLRTMALVSLGAAAYTICSSYGFMNTGLKFDASRMAANVASGVGFIGAGVITTHSIRKTSQSSLSTSSSEEISHSIVHGLTTAAAIWLSAAVGVASGAGLYLVASTASLTTVSILRLGRNMKQSSTGRKIGEKIGIDNTIDTESRNIYLPKYVAATTTQQLQERTAYHYRRQKLMAQQEKQKLLEQRQHQQQQQRQQQPSQSEKEKSGVKEITLRQHESMAIKRSQVETGTNHDIDRRVDIQTKAKAKAARTTSSIGNSQNSNSQNETRQHKKQRKKKFDASKDKDVIEFQKSIENEISSSVVPKISPNLTISKQLVSSPAELVATIGGNGDGGGRSSSSDNVQQKQQQSRTTSTSSRNTTGSNDESINDQYRNSDLTP